ncbi:MAG: hypothetical protein V1871_00655 [Planctomycetota bacterium]
MNLSTNTESNFWSKLKYAFDVEDETHQVFSDEEIKLLNKVADLINKKRLNTAAVMFLESVRPLNFIGSQAMVFLQPIVSFVISTKELDLLSKILEKRKSIPLLIELIEERENG